MNYDIFRGKRKAVGVVQRATPQTAFYNGKNGDFDVFSGWDGRDNGLKAGYVVPKYNMALSRYVTEWDPLDSNIVD